jgi:hypothetical protein
LASIFLGQDVLQGLIQVQVIGLDSTPRWLNGNAPIQVKMPSRNQILGWLPGSLVERHQADVPINTDLTQLW